MLCGDTTTVEMGLSRPDVALTAAAGGASPGTFGEPLVRRIVRRVVLWMPHTCGWSLTAHQGAEYVIRKSGRKIVLAMSSPFTPEIPANIHHGSPKWSTSCGQRGSFMSEICHGGVAISLVINHLASQPRAL
jgi:hypothetical protein